MEKLMYALMAVCMCYSTPVEAQLLGKLKNAAEKAVARKAEQKVTKETEKAMDSLLNEGSRATAPQPGTAPATAPDAAESAEAPASAPKMWSKYNFVPGDEIIFEDDLSKEENGEFPSRWDLINGTAENASVDGIPVIKFENQSVINPLMTQEDYLPEVFTVEFDVYFHDVYAHWQQYTLRFYPGDDSSFKVRDDLYVYPITLQKNGASTHTRNQTDTRNFENYGPSEPDGFSGWKHIAISYNERALKVFIDEERVLNIPNIELAPSMVSIEASSSKKEDIRAIKNIRIAKGGKDLYDRVVADGKFVTRGILFDINKATLKNESMGVINEIAKMMTAHPDLKFSIEGHTDSDGEENHNLQLSAQRAQSVLDALAALGIDKARMQVKGLGESVPVADNSLPEGKANNRRVEFVKI